MRDRRGTGSRVERERGAVDMAAAVSGHGTDDVWQRDANFYSDMCLERRLEVVLLL